MRFISILLLLLLLHCSLGAVEYLQSNYFTKTDSVMLSDIIKNPKKDVLLYSIRENKHTKRVKAKKLLKKLKKHGYKGYASKHNYIQFSQKSPINTKIIEMELINHYKNIYKSITVNSLFLEPRAYIENLPNEYQFGIDNKAYLSNSGYCFITTPERKKIFFNYRLSATVDVYHTKERVERGSELSNRNTLKKSIMLDKFRAMPLETLESHTLEAKHRLKKDALLTSRDVVGLYLVKRGSMVNVSLNSNGITISFTAKAVTSGRLGEIVTLLKSDNKKIKVRVIGKNRAEM